MKSVWIESLSQTEQMIRSWFQSPDRIHSFVKDTRTLSLYVLAATGFGRSFDFQSAKDSAVEKDMASSYRDALSTVLDNVILLILVPYRYYLFCQSGFGTLIEQAAASRSTWSAS
jgi:hypothetical protein